MPTIRIEGPSGPTEVHHLDADVLLIGRAPECEIRLADASLSRVHAKLQRDGGGWLLVDHESSNGTYVNERRVEESIVLQPGDRVRLGDTVLTLSATEPRTNSGDRATMRQRDETSAPPTLIGRSPRIESLRRAIERAAPLDLTVLVRGPTGSGKELVARGLHVRSPRHEGPFVVVNCPALPGALLEAELFGIEKGVATGVDARVGLLQAADGGTLFLDEVGDLEAPAQAKLLRFLETKVIEQVGSRESVQLDVRVVAATHRDLEAAVEDGSFRQDLLHRLDAVTLRTPALTEHREDIPDLVQRFLMTGRGPRADIDAEALAALERREWPGNVRELRHAVERARAFCEDGLITLEQLGESTPSSTGDVKTLYDQLLKGDACFWELVRDPYLKRELSKDTVRELIARAHAEAGGSYSDAARALGLAGEEKKFLNFVNRHGLGLK